MINDPWVRKFPLEEETATHSSILASEIPRQNPGQKIPAGYSPWGYRVIERLSSQRLMMLRILYLHIHHPSVFYGENRFKLFA